MANKREQRLRRKAQAALRKVEGERDEATKLKPIALAAIRFINENDSPNPHDRYSVAQRRDELADAVHAHQGCSGRQWRGQQIVRREEQPKPAPVVALRTLPAPVPVRARGAQLGHGESRESLSRDLEVKRVELRNAAKRYGAEANKRRRDMQRVAELGAALDAASKAFSLAEARLRIEDNRIAREAMGAAS